MLIDRGMSTDIVQAIIDTSTFLQREDERPLKGIDPFYRNDSFVRPFSIADYYDANHFYGNGIPDLEELFLTIFIRFSIKYSLTFSDWRDYKDKIIRIACNKLIFWIENEFHSLHISIKSWIESFKQISEASLHDSSMSFVPFTSIYKPNDIVSLLNVENNSLIKTIFNQWNLACNAIN